MQKKIRYNNDASNERAYFCRDTFVVFIDKSISTQPNSIKFFF